MGIWLFVPPDENPPAKADPNVAALLKKFRQDPSVAVFEKLVEHPYTWDELISVLHSRGGAALATAFIEKDSWGKLQSEGQKWAKRNGYTVWRKKKCFSDCYFLRKGP